MPPKKSSTPATNGDATAPPDANTKFTWEGANDYKLLLLTQGRYVKPDEYENLASAFTGDTSTGSIRNRISKLRVLQRNLYEGLAWDLPEGGAGYSAKTPVKKPAGTGTTAGKTVGRKRGGSVDGGSGETGRGGKKARVEKGCVGKQGGEEEVEGGGAKVKVEEVEEEDC